jgi:transcription elongation factor Elf1
MREKILRFLNSLFIKKLDCPQCKEKECVIYNGDVLIEKEWKGTLICKKCNKQFIIEQ